MTRTKKSHRVKDVVIKRTIKAKMKQSLRRTPRNKTTHEHPGSVAPGQTTNKVCFAQDNIKQEDTNTEGECGDGDHIYAQTVNGVCVE